MNSYSIPEQWPTDPVLVEFLPEFIHQWQTDLGDAFTTMLARHNVEELNRLGHTIKGSFLQFGFNELSGMGKEIMMDAKAEDWTALEEKVNVLKGILDAMNQRLQSNSAPE